MPMPMPMPCFYAPTLLLLLLLVLSWTWSFQISHSHAHTFTFEMHHGFSEPVRKWVSSHSQFWPLKGTIDYYSALADRDRLFLLRGRRRRLSNTINDSIAFSDGNSTLRISSMGFLHYAAVSLGTPSKKFFVALDTGSDLFWVPCDCTTCPPTTPISTYGSGFEPELNVYDPDRSSTSKKITCNNNLCSQRNRCLGTFSNCPYAVSYISADTSTSGILVEDILHLTTEEGQPKVVDAWITFGCGQVQTGSFLRFAAPNGLFGLGREKISVPSMLSRIGLTADSFSMCFGRDGFGTISFGDKGSPDQDETPFSLNLLHPTYTVTVTEIRIGKSIIDTHFNALFDTGTSFTYMVDPTYTQFSESFNLHTRDTRLSPDHRIPFEYCYRMSSNANSSLIPSISLTMEGGSQFSVYDPIIVISSQFELVYCLAILKNTDLNIIGQNFMTGYKVVFDREKLMLGWKNSDCYPNKNILPSNLRDPAEALPAVAAGPSSCAPEAKNDSENKSYISVEPTSEVSMSPHLTYSYTLVGCGCNMYSWLSSLSTFIILYSSFGQL